MKKHILTLALATAMIGAIATGCSSQEKAAGSDTTAVDSSAAAPAATDTTAAPAAPAPADTTNKM